MNPSFCCLALIALLPIAGQAATIYRCDVAGVPTFQDTPCAAASAASAVSPKTQLLQERRTRLLQRRRALMAQLLELQAQSSPEGGTADAPVSEGGDYTQQAERQRLQWTHQARIEQARQRLAELDDNLRLLDERIGRLPAP